MTEQPPDTTNDEIHDRARQYLAREHPESADAELHSVAGDASTRRYFRVTDRQQRSTVLAVYPDPTELAASAFVEIDRLLMTMDVPVPAVLGRSDSLGVLELEDLGNRTLQAHLGRADEGERDARYREAIEILIALQRQRPATRPAGHAPPPPFDRRFDATTFTRELQFFTTHFLEGHRGLRLDPATRAALGLNYARLAHRLASEPSVLCHRDYHSRNLMVYRERLYVIDFQDARMGPDTYDLVSLLYDAYVEITGDETARFIDLFLDRRNAGQGCAADAAPVRAQFRARFESMAIQRLLKALGTFGFQATVRHNNAYVPYMAGTLVRVRSSLRRGAEGETLLALLAPLLPELD